MHTIIGITGPMCAGKNRAAGILEKNGYKIADADVIAHQALNDVQAEVISTFRPFAEQKGISLLLDNGSINRRALGSLLFTDAKLLALHESIIYPRINFLLHQFIDLHPGEKIAINAPLLYKSPVLEQCSMVIFIDSCIILRFFRALSRDNMPIRQIFARFFAQKHLFAQYIKKNVDIQRVHNRGSIRALEKKLTKLVLTEEY